MVLQILPALILFLTHFSAGQLAPPEFNTEIKFILQTESTKEAYERLRLGRKQSKDRRTYFFDTPNLDLYRSRLNLRTRQEIGEDKVEVTVKILGMRFSEVDAAWFSIRGFKCENDQADQTVTPNCSLESKVASSLVEEVLENHRAIKDLLSADQWEFLTQFYRALDSVPWRALRAFGPIQSRSWKLPVEALPAKLAVENWTLPNHESNMEISLRVPTSQVEEARSSLLLFLRKQQLQIAPGAEGKTLWALTSLSKN